MCRVGCWRSKVLSDLQQILDNHPFVQPGLPRVSTAHRPNATFLIWGTGMPIGERFHGRESKCWAFFQEKNRIWYKMTPHWSKA